jgi:hypothetical protein
MHFWKVIFPGHLRELEGVRKWEQFFEKAESQTSTWQWPNVGLARSGTERDNFFASFFL